MKLAAYFRSVGAKLFRRSQVESEMDEELRAHIQYRVEDLERSGLSRAEALRRARIEFGGEERFKDDCRESLGGNFVETMAGDVRFSLRVLRKSPGFTTVAVLSLALAIGANAVVFAVMNALVLRPLNVPNEDSLYLVQAGGIGFQSYPNYVDIRDQNHTFENLAAMNVTQVGLDTGDTVTRAWINETSGNYFDAIGIGPYLGRVYHASDERGPNSAPYIVLSWGYWHNHFQDDRSVVGRIVRINKHPFTIIGVAPREFHGTFLLFGPDFWVPIVNHAQLDGVGDLKARAARWIFSVVGHLKPGVTPAQAMADLKSIDAYLQKTYPVEAGKMNFSLARPGLYGDFLGRPVRAFLTALMLLAGLILLAACANLGSLFAARAADRGREVALRLALGASRGRILRQLFTESVLISVMGGAVGLAGSMALLGRLSAWQPFPRFPVTMPVNPDAKVYLVALLLALVSGVLFGLVPVRQVLRTDPYQVVKAGSTATFGRRVSVRDVLLVTQIAICAVLVTSSLVAVRGLGRSMHANFGIQPEGAMLLETSMNQGNYAGDAAPAMQKRMIEAMENIPGVDSVGLVDYPPLAMSGNRTLIYTDQTRDMRASNAAAQPFLYSVSPAYFAAAGTAMLAGRSVTWHDDAKAPRVAVVNREFARKIFGSVSDAIGKYFKRRDGSRVQVIGVVEDGKYLNLSEEQSPAMFVSVAQTPSKATWLVVRSRRDPAQLASDMKLTMRNLDASLPYYLQTWTREMDGVLFPSRVASVALGVLGMMGAMLSITGIFGMAAYSVSKRLRELGIRLALGARRKEVLETALGRAIKLLAVGSTAGLVLGILASRVLAAIVYHATPRDPLVLGGVIVAMSLLGLLASWIPAQRALSLDPVRLLREE